MWTLQVMGVKTNIFSRMREFARREPDEKRRREEYLRLFIEDAAEEREYGEAAPYWRA